MIKTSSDILLEAANLLEEEGKWGKGKYFNFNDKGCAMCAHGAIAYCGNPKVRKYVDEKNQVTPGWLIAPFGATSPSLKRIQEGAASKNLSPEQYILQHYGELELAHYKASNAGLTFKYNDHDNTTKQDVINKLREAALETV